MVHQLRNSISDKSNEVLKKIISDEKLKNKGEAIDFLCSEYLSNERLKLSEERIALRVKKELSKELNISRVRTGYADKGIKISLDLLNHIALQGKFDNDILFDTKDYKSRIYNLSEQRIQALIEHYDQKKKDRQLESEE